MGSNNIKYHSTLARYFENQERYLDEEKRKPNTRKLVEQPWQQTKAELWDDVTETLCDLLFMEAKCEFLGIDELLVDFGYSLAFLKNDTPEKNLLIRNLAIIDRFAHILRKEPQILLQLIYNELIWNHELDLKLWDSVTKEITKSKHLLLLEACEPVNNESKALRTIVSPNNKLYCISLSKDERWLAGACGDLGTCIWEARTGVLHKILNLSGELCHDRFVAFNSEGTVLVTCGWSSYLRIWNPETGKLIHTIDIYEILEDLIYSEKLHLFFIIDVKGGLYVMHELDYRFEIVHQSQIIDVPSDLPKYLIPQFIHSATREFVTRLAVSPNGDYSATAERSGVIRIVDHNSSNKLVLQSKTHNSEFHDYSVTKIGFTTDSKYLVSINKNFYWRMWCLPDLNPVYEKKAHRASVSSLAFHPDGSSFATGGEDGEIHIWNVNTGEKESTILGHFGYIDSLEFSSDGNRLYSAANEGTIKVWDVRSISPIERKACHSRILHGARFSPKGKFLASWAEDYSLRIWRVDDLSCQKSEEFNWYPLDVAFSFDEQFFAVGSMSGSVSVYNTNSWEFYSLMGNKGASRLVEFSPDGIFIAVGYDGGNVSLWNTKDKTEKTLPELIDAELIGINSIKFSSDGSELYITVGFRLIIYLINSNELREVTPYSRVGLRQKICVMSKGGKVAVNNISKTIEIIDTKDGSTISIIKGPVNDLNLKSLSVSNDDCYLATAGGSESVEIWSVNSGTRVGIFYSSHSVLAVHFLPNSNRILVADHGGSLHIPNVHELQIVANSLV